MTQQISNTTWTVAVVADNSVLAAYAEHIRRSKAVAAAIDFDYNAILDWFYNANGEKTTEFNVGYCAYFGGLKRDELTTGDMKRGFDEAHGAMQWSAALDEDAYADEPGYRASWMTY